MQLDKEDLAVIIEEHNPFFLKKAKGRICFFKDYSELYLYVLRKLREQYPKGYIEMALFLCDNCGTDIKYGTELVRGWKKTGYESDPILLEWNGDKATRNLQLRLIMVCLHTLSGTRFNQELFNIAIEKFDYMFNPKSK